MKLGFVLFKYFPYGGLQRDMLRIARECQQRGHEVHIFTLSWQGPKPTALHVHLLPIKRLSNHAKYQAFHAHLQPLLHTMHIERLVGFNKLPGLDWYYAADPCLAHKLDNRKGQLLRLLPRYRHFLDYEAAVFAPGQHTRILLIAPPQQSLYQRYYGTEAHRMILLPPGIQKDRKANAQAPLWRAQVRREFGIDEHEYLILCIGSGFKTKGLDRALRALAALPAPLRMRCHLLALGNDNPKPFLRLAKRLDIIRQVRILPGRDDIPRILQGGDLLLHPAYYESAGHVLLEAIVAGLPVLTTASCGYANHVERARAGIVLPEPFSQKRLDATLEAMLHAPQKTQWRANGIDYGQTQDLYHMVQHAADALLQP